MADRSQRACYGEKLVELGKTNDRIVSLEADLGKSTMSCLFQKAFPQRYYQMGIAEADMVSFAAGLAISGKIPFVNTFAVFATGRPYDQIKQSICVSGLNVKIIGSSAGLSDCGDGATHQSIDDVAIMRVLPNMTVLVPCDGREAEEMTEFAANCDGPVYLRISRNSIPPTLPADSHFELGKAVTIREGEDYVIFAMGEMVRKALEAAEQLKAENGLQVRVVNVSTLKPFNDEAIRGLASGMRGIITAEEHSVIGGLTSAVTYALRGEAIPVEAVAIMDRFGQSAMHYEEIMACYGLDASSMVRKIQAMEGNAK